MNTRTRGLVTLTIGVVLGCTLSLTAGVLADKPGAAKDTLPWEQARLLAEVLEYVRHDYVETVDDETLFEDAIRGMIAGLDPHSAFMNAEEYREIRITTRGNYSGVGLEVNLDGGTVRVVSPIDGTPAQRAGIEPGDIITQIDGVDVDPDNLNPTVSKMRGAPGSPVQLTIERKDGQGRFTYDLKRERIQLTSVRGALLEPGYGYLRISQFSETTGRDLQNELAELERSNDGKLEALVLDLRNNPGGVLDAAVAVADAFLDSGVIVTAEGRIDDARFMHSAQPGDLAQGARLAVLVNAGSASASEIVAGALRDHGRALVMGEVTYGKGSVQTVMPLSNGQAIKLTTSRYFTPSGESIHGTGITPDISLESDQPEDYAFSGLPEPYDLDYQLDQALGYLREEALAHQTIDPNITTHR